MLLFEGSEPALIVFESLTRTPSLPPGLCWQDMTGEKKISKTKPWYQKKYKNWGSAQHSPSDLPSTDCPNDRWSRESRDIPSRTRRLSGTDAFNGFSRQSPHEIHRKIVEDGGVWHIYIYTQPISSSASRIISLSCSFALTISCSRSLFYHHIIHHIFINYNI